MRMGTGSQQGPSNCASDWIELQLAIELQV